MNDSRNKNVLRSLWINERLWADCHRIIEEQRSETGQSITMSQFIRNLLEKAVDNHRRGVLSYEREPKI
jgi:hypothetical protein